MSNFEGFPDEGMKFLDDLAANNSRDWFVEHKSRYQEFLQRPAIVFIEVMGERLKSISEMIQFDTRTNGAGSLMRIARDTRFSKDKTPYKTAIAGMFWQGDRKKTESSAFGFHLESNGMYLMAGIFNFQRDQLEKYRNSVDNSQQGGKLVEIIDLVRSAGYTVNGEHYKRVPKPYENSHERADLLKYKGLYASFEKIDPSVVMSSKIIDECFSRYEIISPVQQWLVETEVC
jgi:uncharacterized protein (TIGR02453 family)